MEAVAKHDFNATADDELSFRKGAVLKVSIILLFFDLANLFLRDLNCYSLTERKGLLKT